MFDTDPPTSIDSLNPQVTYRKPSRGTMKFEDGEVVTYTCSNPSKEDIFVNRSYQGGLRRGSRGSSCSPNILDQDLFLCTHS